MSSTIEIMLKSIPQRKIRIERRDDKKYPFGENSSYTLDQISNIPEVLNTNEDCY